MTDLLLAAFCVLMAALVGGSESLREAAMNWQDAAVMIVANVCAVIVLAMLWRRL